MQKKEIEKDIPGENENTPTVGRDEDPFKIEEIVLEEVSIDGICGVY